MAQKKGFSCPACGAEFDTRDQLDNHNRKEHKSGAQSTSNTSTSSAGRAPDRGQTGTTK